MLKTLADWDLPHMNEVAYSANYLVDALMVVKGNILGFSALILQERWTGFFRYETEHYSCPDNLYLRLLREAKRCTALNDGLQKAPSLCQ